MVTVCPSMAYSGKVTSWIRNPEATPNRKNSIDADAVVLPLLCLGFRSLALCASWLRAIWMQEEEAALQQQTWWYLGGGTVATGCLGNGCFVVIQQLLSLAGNGVSSTSSRPIFTASLRKKGKVFLSSSILWKSPPSAAAKGNFWALPSFFALALTPPLVQVNAFLCGCLAVLSWWRQKGTLRRVEKKRYCRSKKKGRGRGVTMEGWLAQSICRNNDVFC